MKRVWVPVSVLILVMALVGTAPAQESDVIYQTSTMMNSQKLIVNQGPDYFT